MINSRLPNGLGSIAASGQIGPFSRSEDFAERLAECFGLLTEELEAALYQVDPELFAAYLASDHDLVVQLRDDLGLDPRKIDVGMLSEGLLAPEGRICAAVFDALQRMKVCELAPEVVLHDRVQRAKAAVVAAWTNAVDFAAPHGFITSDDAYLLGIGEAVYCALLSHSGKSSIEALSREAFLQFAPLLVETWPVSEDGLLSLMKVLSETEEYIAIRENAKISCTCEAVA